MYSYDYSNDKKMINKNKKGQQTPTGILIMIIMFGIIITGAVVSLGSISNQYGVSVNDNFSNTLTKINETQGYAQQMVGYADDRNASNVETTDTSWQDQSMRVVVSFINAFKLIWNIPGIVYSIINDLVIYVGLPGWVIPGLLAIIGLIIFASIYYAVTGRNG